MEKQTYMDLKKRHEKEVADFPIAYAFNDEQLEEALTKLGATRREVVTIFGHGDIVKKTDAKAFIDMLKRHSKETMDRLIEDHEFAESAFLYEMDNHEYAINYDGDEDVLRCFGLEYDDLEKHNLYEPYRRARKRHMTYAQDWM